MTQPASNGPPGVDLRIVFFTIHDSRLLVALTTGGVGRRLPRGLPAVAETLDGAARQIVRTATGVQERYLEQLYTLSVRNPPPWTVVVSYVALVSTDAGTRPVGAEDLWHQAENLPSLSETDRMVVDYALFRLRAKLGYTNIAFHLMPPTFTLTELQSAYETILARRLDKRNFRRRMIASGILEQTPEKRREGSHRPATLYRFRPESDGETYLTPPWADEA
jgi:8-oxo-dGTP diphosphatase